MVDKSVEKKSDSNPESVHGGGEEETLKYGRELVTHLAVLLKTLQIHDPSNVAMENPTNKMMQCLQRLWQWDHAISLRLAGDYLFLDDMRLRMDMERFVSFTKVIEELKRTQIGTLSFTIGLEPYELKRAIFIISQADTSQGDPFEFISERFNRSSIRNVEIEALEEIKDLDGSIQKNSKERAKSSYFKTLTTVGEAIDNVKLGRAVSVKRAKRSVQTLVDILLADETTLLGLTTLRCHDVYTHNHSVNVCVLTLALGQRLGYPPDQLTLLGLSGLFHDLGKAYIPPEILNKSTEFTQEDWQMMRRHPAEGVKYLLRLKGINEMTIRIIKGIFEHHLNYDLSGYPKIQGEWNVSLFGRIISIVDCYDALTSSRVYNRTPYSPEKALKFMFGRRGRTFDAALLKTFINCIGIFPIGTVVLLTTGELAVVLRSHPDTEKGDRPSVKIITNPEGGEVDGEEIDLANHEASEMGIVRTVDPTKYSVDISKYFI